MAAVGLLHRIHAQGANRVDGELFNAGFGFGDGHSFQDGLKARLWVMILQNALSLTLVHKSRKKPPVCHVIAHCPVPAA
jgi:hypothetical protein